MANFNEKVYFVVKHIPFGMVMSYGQIARIVGNPRTSRAVGYALNAVKEEWGLPCHRVMYKDGTLTADYVFGGSGEQYRLLKAEGITFDKQKKVKMDKHRWDASEMEEFLMVGF